MSDGTILAESGARQIACLMGYLKLREAGGFSGWCESFTRLARQDNVKEKSVFLQMDVIFGQGGCSALKSCWNTASVGLKTMMTLIIS